MNPPVACSLTAGDLAGRRDRWRRLVERALSGHETTDDGVRLRFRELPGVAAELGDLAALERGCCGFAQWRVKAGRREVTLTVSAAGEGVPAVRELFASLSAGG